MRIRLRAVVLAAGFGTRLRPLTERCPKPALPVAGRPLAALTLERLAAAGCEAAAVNLHYLGDRVRRALGEAVGGMPLTYSVERPIQGTLGALTALRSFLEPADLVLVVNGDSLCRWPLARLLRRHRTSGAAATLLLAARARPAEFGGGVAVDRHGWIVALRGGAPRAAGRAVFAGAQLLEPRLLAGLEVGPAGLVEGLYEPLLAAGERLAAVTTRRRWFDLGTPERYRRAVLAWVRGARPWGRSWLAPGAEVDPSARLRRVVVEAGAAIAGRAEVSGSVLLPGARVGRGARLERCVVGFDAEVPAGAELAGRLVTPAAPAGAAPAAGSRVGNAVFTPLA